MKKRLFTSILVMMVAMALPSSVWADTETYDFKTIASSYVTLSGATVLTNEEDQDNHANRIVYDDTKKIGVYKLSFSDGNGYTDTFNNRFACATGKFSLRYNGAYTGLWNQGDYDNLFAILDLKAGDKVTITQRSGETSYMSYTTYSTAAISNLEEQSLQLVSGTTYTVQTDGNLVMRAPAAGIHIEKIVIETQNSLAVDYESSKGAVSITSPENSTLGTTKFYKDQSVTLKAIAVNNYQFAGWKASDGSTPYGTLPNSVELTLTMPDNNLSLNAAFEAVPAVSAVETAKTWTFDNFAAGTILTINTPYGYDGYYVTGHNTEISKGAKISAESASATAEQFGGEAVSVSNCLYFTGTQTNNSINANKAVNDGLANTFAFRAGCKGVLYVLVKNSKDESLNIYINGARTQKSITTSVSVVSAVISEAANIFIGPNGGNPSIYAVRFVPTSTTAITDEMITLGNSGTLTYTGEQQTMTVTVKNGDTNLVENTDYTVTGNTGTEVSTYTLTITGTGSYSGSVEKQWSITQATGTITFDPASGTKNVGDADYEISATLTGDGTISGYSSSNESVATVSQSEGKWKIHIVGAGTTNIKATVTDGTNYKYSPDTEGQYYVLAVSEAESVILVNEARTWTFNDYTLGETTVATTNYKSQTNGLYNRTANSGRTNTIAECGSKQITFSDGSQITVSKYATSSGGVNRDKMSSEEINAKGDYDTPYFAFKTEVAGTCYAYVNKNSGIWFYPQDGTTNSYQASGDAEKELSITANQGGVYYIGGVTENSERNIYAIRFVPTHTLTFATEPTEMATITIKDGNTTVTSGSAIEEGKTLTIEVSGITEGYEVDNVKVNNGNALTATDGKYTFTMPTADATVTVTLKLKSYTLTAAQATNGSISFTVGGQAATTAKMGDEVTVVAAPATNYQLSTLVATPSTVTISDNKFTMPASDVEVTATFTSTAVVPTEFSYGTFDFKNFVINNSIENGTKPTWGATIDGAVQVLTYVSGSVNETFGNRFAAGPVAQNATDNCFKFRKDDGDTYTGLYSQYADRTFSILGLNVGDRITFTFANANTTLTYGDNVSVVNNQTITVTEAGRMDFTSAKGVVVTQVRVEAPLTQYTVTAESSNTDQGTVAITDASSDNKYDQGSSVTVTATAKSGYEFDYWTNGESTDSYSTENPLTITSLGADFALKAHFKKGETVTPPTCEAATDGKVSTADGKVTIIAGRSDNSEATVTTYYKTSLFADVPEIDESWSTLPDNGVVTMEKSGYIFVYAKSSTGVLTGITTIDVELPVYGKYDFAGIATENVEDGNSNPQAITWSNGNLIVGENTIGLNRTFSGDKIALRRTTSDQGLYVQYDAGYLTISRLNVNDIVKVEYSAGSLDIKSGTADPLGNTTDGHSTASYVIKGGNDLSLNVSKAAWIYSVEISNDDAVSAPVISVSDSKEITINGGTSLQGKAVTIYYTTDGTNPTTNSTEYTGPFTPEKTVYIKAFSVIADNTDIQSPVAEQKVSIGTFTGEKNVFDFAALAGDFGEFAFAETAVSLNEYWNASTPNEDRDFYEITNTDHFTSVDNSVKVLMRAKTGNTLSYANGGMTGSNSGLIALTGLTEGQRIVVEYKEGGSVRYNTGVDKGEVTVGGNTLERGSTISSGAFVTVTSGDYIVLYNVANSTITKISVLDPAATYSVGLPSSSEHGTVEANVTSAGEGETVTLTVTPDDGYVVESVTVEDADNSTVAVTTLTANSTYTFVMPAQNVTVTVTFAKFVEASVGETRTWTFDDLSGTYTEIKEVNGAYLRGFGTRTFTVTDGEEQTLTFADGEKVTVSKYLAVGHSMYPLAFTESSTAASTATKANSSNVEELIGAGSFAVNTTVAGTIYAKIGTPTDQKVRIYCTDAIDSPKTFELKAADGIQEVSYTTTAENGGTFFIGGVEGMYDIYAVRFVPTSEAARYALTVGEVTNGTITVKDGSTKIDGSAEVLPGTTLTLTATPVDGYQLKEWQDGSGSAIGAIQNSMVTTVAMPAEAMTVKAVFEVQPESVTAITKDQTLTFDSYTTGISLSGSKVYAASDNLYINGHSDSAPAQVTANGISEGVTLGSATGVTVGKSLWMRGGNDKVSGKAAVNSSVQDAIGLNISEKGLLYVLLSGTTSDTDRYFNIYVNGVKNQTKIADNNPVVISQAITAETSDVFITVSGGDWRAYAIRFEAVSFTEQETDDTESGSKVYAVVTNDGATIAAASIAEEDETITISKMDGKPVKDIAAGVFTESNTANVSAIDLSETAVNWGTETEPAKRDEVPALANIDASTLIYLPSTANVTGTNVVVKSGTGDTYTCSDFEVDNGKLENGKSVVVPKEFKADKVTLKRTFTADKKCTVCLPYAFTAAGGTFYKFNGISEGKVQMQAQTDGATLEANTPYIFMPDNTTEEAGNISTTASGEKILVAIKDAETADASSSFTFKGTYEAIDWTEKPTKPIYGFAAEDKDGSEVGSFVKIGAGASIKACRAYLEYEGNSTPGSIAATRGMNDLPDVLEIEWIPASGKGTTGIEDARRAADDSEAVYNMRGQRVDKSYKGLVIVNGKKVVRK